MTTRLLEDPQAGYTVLYESVSMIAYPWMFASRSSAEGFLRENPEFHKLPDLEQYKAWANWVNTHV